MGYLVEAGFFEGLVGAYVTAIPGGHLLCVIPVHSDPEYFAQRATQWG